MKIVDKTKGGVKFGLLLLGAVFKDKKENICIKADSICALSISPSTKLIGMEFDEIVQPLNATLTIRDLEADDE